MITVSESELHRLIERVFAAAGVPEAHATAMADALVLTNLRAVDSHGVQLLPHYVGQIERGEVDVHTTGRVISENGAAMIYEGGHGIGQVTAPICCDHAVRLAEAHGLGMVVAREANHFGAAFLWSSRISAHGMIGLTVCDASMAVPPWQGREPRLGTNPISVSVPHRAGQGWLLDMATTTVAFAKVEQLMLKGETTVPHGWSLDREGVPTTDMAVARTGLLAPLGGYKGSGLAMMVEILCGVLGGGEAFGNGVTGLRNTGRPMRANQTFLAIDVRRFLPLEDFEGRMERLVGDVKSSQPARGYGEVLVAGDPEWRAMKERRRNGIPVPDGVWRTVAEVAGRLGVPLPG
jgi:LDH2 family malate/lactate/ureidoglycolate dehydrogenase